MRAEDIQTVVDFHRFVSHLVDTAAMSYRGTLEAYLVDTAAMSYRGTLEAYLSALWSLVQQHRTTPTSYALFGQLLADAFTSTPPPFDEQWLTYDAPPEEVGIDPAEVADGFVFVQNLLLYQIADLHRMRAAGLLDQPGHILQMGVTSPTGETWYNCSPVSFLGGASILLPDELGAGAENDQSVSVCTWGDLASFLWLGQIYE
jgi:hypothetical protein